MPEKQKMVLFTLGPVSLEIPAGLLNRPLRRQLRLGRYEQVECRALRLHLHPEDRILELGGGVGYLAAVAGAIVAGPAITVVEANPDLIPVIKHNVARNSVPGVRVLHGAVSGSEPGETMVFHLSRAFWASSAAGRGTEAERKLTVPTLKLPVLLETCDPTVLVVDVEGAEEHLFDHDIPPHVRLIVLELHPKVFSSVRVTGDIFARLARSGFYYQPLGSRGDVVCFSRI